MIVFKNKTIDLSRMNFVSFIKNYVFACLLLSAINVSGQKIAIPIIQKQDVEIIPAQNGYFLRGQSSGKILSQYKDAAQAIEEGMKRMKEGGELLLHKGVYFLDKEIRVQPHITLKGKGRSTEIMITAKNPTGVAFLIAQSDYVTIESLSIKPDKKSSQAKSGVIIDNCGKTTIRNVDVLYMNDYGILVRNKSFLTDIISCSVFQSGKSGIRIENANNGMRGGDFVSNTVRDCWVMQGNVGIECDFAICANLVNNTVYQTKSNAFRLVNQSNSVLISGNRSFQIQTDAVYIQRSHEVNVSSNIFCWQEGHGIVVNGSKWGTITGNNFIDNGSINIFEKGKDSFLPFGDRQFRIKARTSADQESKKSGIVLENQTKGITVTGNAIFNWPAAPKMLYGITEDNTCENNSFISNNINTYSNKDVYSQGKGSIAVNNIGFGTQAYTGNIGTELLQSFDLGLIENFIKENWHL